MLFPDLQTFLRATDEPDWNPGEKSIWVRWWRFHMAHPEVYSDLLRRAKLIHDRGYSRYSAKTLYELCRWHFQFERDSTEDWKLANEYHSRYARLLMAQHPELAGVFQLRRLLRP